MLGEKKSRQLIRRARRENEDALIAVTGCYAQLAPEIIAQLPGVRLVVGTKDRARIVELVEEAAKADGVVREVGDIMHADTFEDIPLFFRAGKNPCFSEDTGGLSEFLHLLHYPVYKRASEVKTD
jgi:threonylcarbamoyladenosine tRNA methylthiotransferase MtaB